MGYNISANPRLRKNKNKTSVKMEINVDVTHLLHRKKTSHPLIYRGIKYIFGMSSVL